MTIASTTSKVSYNGSGSTGPFTITFKFSKNADIVVTKVSTAGVESTLTLTTHYTLTGAGEDSGGTLTLVTALATGEKLIIKRSPSIVQETDYVENADFPAESHEDALDLLTMICQDLDERLDRAVTIPISSSVSPTDYLTTVEAYKTSAASSAATATAQAALATTARINAETAETNAEAAQTAAELAETNAETAETNAEAAQTAAEAARNLSQTYSLNSLSYKQTASSAATSATASAGTATTQAGLASGYASNANASAVSAAAAAAKLAGTSTSSNVISVASKTFTTQSGKFFDAGTFVEIVSDADPSTNWMHGQVTSYSSTTLVVNVTSVGGSGTKTDWTIRVSGARGAAGASSPASALLSATTTVDVSAATAPSTGQVLTATASNAATWQTPTPGFTVLDLQYYGLV